jgi:hypothetical protein
MVWAELASLIRLFWLKRDAESENHSVLCPDLRS